MLRLPTLSPLVRIKAIAIYYWATAVSYRAKYISMSRKCNVFKAVMSGINCAKYGCFKKAMDRLIFPTSMSCKGALEKIADRQMDLNH